MKKSLYSLMLADDVVNEIDKLAYAAGTNRSNMINQILAEHVSYITPERRVRSMIDKIADILPVDTFKIMDSRSDFFFSACSPLSFKYNPTVKYTLAVFKTPSEKVGELRVSVRSSSQSLMDCFKGFFTSWQSAEFRHGGDVFWHEGQFKFSKELIYRDDSYQNNSGAGDDIASYIAYLDKAMKNYFACLSPYSAKAARQASDSVFEEYANTSGTKFR
ncbi:MAG: hypothetical protein IJS94_04750 [Clostridia bacterium]|nr:hypothetical protein [Clostridia bacterium]